MVVDGLHRFPGSAAGKNPPGFTIPTTSRNAPAVDENGAQNRLLRLQRLGLPAGTEVLHPWASSPFSIEYGVAAILCSRRSSPSAARRSHSPACSVTVYVPIVLDGFRRCVSFPLVQLDTAALRSSASAISCIGHGAEQTSRAAALGDDGHGHLPQCSRRSPWRSAFSRGQ